MTAKKFRICAAFFVNPYPFSKEVSEPINFCIRTAATATLMVCSLGVVSTSNDQNLHVRDADTIVVKGTPVRLKGVDAPELDTRAGQDAKRWMIEYLEGKQIRCELTGETTYDRWVGVCYANDQDIGGAVIAAGHALDCARFSGGRYRGLETAEAKAALRRAPYC